MADQKPVIYTPLQHATFHGGGIVMGESLFCAKVVVRGAFDNPQIRQRLDDLLQLDTSLAPNTFAENEDKVLFWTGPDERMIHAFSSEPERLVEDLRQIMPAGKSSVVDVSDYYTIIRVAGNNARRVLASGTPFDLHARAFGEGSCAQTRFGTATVLLAMRDDSPAFDVQVRWSFADYVWRYLQRVAGFRAAAGG